MATYKLIQDIEAEDHILGPLTLRQFIFALIAVFLLYICFFMITKHAAFMLVIFLPPALFFLFFALPFGKDQPTETWALAKLRFWFKPQQRVWNQDGVKEMVTITVPKKIEVVRTNGLSQGEVKSRLSALADTLDTRGWAVKNVNVETYRFPLTLTSGERLLDVDTMPMQVPDNDLPASADMLDEVYNPVAQQFSNLIDQSTENHRQELIAQMNAPAPQPAQTQTQTQQQNDYWFMNGNPAAVSTVPAPKPADVNVNEEAAILSQLRHNAAATNQTEVYGNLRTIQPIGNQTVPQQTTPAAPIQPAVTAPSDPAILSLAKNDDLDVATLAREARRVSDDDDEVVIPLH